MNQIKRLMLSWLENVPDLVECDRKYIDLADTIKAQLELWPSEEPVVPPENSESTVPPATSSSTATPRRDSMSAALNKSLARLNISLQTPGGANRRRSLPWSISSENVDPQASTSSSQKRKSMFNMRHISTPFAGPQKIAKVARGSIEKRISEIDANTSIQHPLRNVTLNSETSSTADSFLTNSKK